MSMIQIPYPFQKLSKRFTWLQPFFTLVLLLFFLSAPLFFCCARFILRFMVYLLIYVLNIIKNTIKINT